VTHSNITLSADTDETELAKLKGFNLSKIFREAIKTKLKLSGDDMDMLETRLKEIRLQVDILNLEEKFVLDGIKALQKEETVLQYREDAFEKWKSSIAFQIKNKTITWGTLTKLFRFRNDKECKDWIEAKITAEAPSMKK
jgi:hypothetical protein